MHTTQPHAGATMRAVVFQEFGGPEVLQIMELPMPQPGDGEVVVRVAAATVNPTDLMMRAGLQKALMTGLTPPYIAGMEFAGHVHAVGKGVSGLVVGQPVMGLVNPRRPAGGAHAQFIVVPASSLAPLERSTDLVQASTVPMNGITARMVMDVLALRPGSRLLVTGAAGAVGGYVVQLAKHAGLTVVADAKDSDVDLVRQLGADDVVPRGDAMAGVVSQHYPDGVDGLADCALLGDRAAALVRSGGVAVALRRSNPIKDPRLTAHYVSVVDQVHNTAGLACLGTWVQEGVLTPRVGLTLPMSEAVQAHRLLEQGGMRGRIVLLFDV